MCRSRVSDPMVQSLRICLEDLGLWPDGAQRLGIISIKTVKAFVSQADTRLLETSSFGNPVKRHGR